MWGKDYEKKINNCAPRALAFDSQPILWLRAPRKELPDFVQRRPQDLTEMYVQHMVQATEGVHPDLLQYIFASWTAMKTLKLVVTGALLVVTGALLVATRS